MKGLIVITACRDSEKTIAATLESINAQTDVDFEHIVIDGSSNDHTLELVHHANSNLMVLSESDVGLYEALNKGVSLATEEIVGFLHADDLLAHDAILKKIQHTFETTKADAVYGDLQYVDADLSKVVRTWRSGKPGSFKTGWMPPHPTLYVNRRVFEKIGDFRTDLGSAADYEWMLRAIHVHKIKLAYIPEVLVKMRVGGMSNAGLTARKQGWKYDLRAWEVNGLGRNYLAVLLKKLRKMPQYFFK